MAAEGGPAIGLSATEISGDGIGALLMGGLSARIPGVSFCGIGMEKMRAAGLDEVCGADFAVMGYWDAALKLRKILAVRNRLVARMLETRPAAFLGIDSPDFNFGVERRLRGAGIRAAHVVSPSIWAWRPGRIRAIRRSVDLMLCLFPFEEKIYREAGVPVAVVGHPDADASPDRADPAAARARLGIGGEPVVAMMPGSRKQELANHLQLFMEAAALVAGRHEGAVFLLPAANAACMREIEGCIRARGGSLNLVAVPGHATDCLEAADVAVVKSGTSTLQALLYRVPMVIVYRMSAVAYALVRARRLHSDYVGLPNILAGKELCAELIQERATAGGIADEVDKWLLHPSRVGEYRARAQEIRSGLRLGAVGRATEAVAGLLGKDGG